MSDYVRLMQVFVMCRGYVITSSSVIIISVIGNNLSVIVRTILVWSKGFICEYTLIVGVAQVFFGRLV